MAKYSPCNVFLKGMGAPIHPDTFGFDGTHEEYVAQAKKYYDFYGFHEEWEDFKAKMEKNNG